jgi:hypothetical protein
MDIHQKSGQNPREEKNKKESNIEQVYLTIYCNLLFRKNKPIQVRRKRKIISIAIVSYINL